MAGPCFNLIVEKVALLASAERQKEGLLLVGPTRSGKPQRAKVHGAAASVLQGLQLKAKLLGVLVLLVFQALEDFPHVKHLPPAAESTATEQVLQQLGLKKSSLLFT